MGQRISNPRRACDKPPLYIGDSKELGPLASVNSLFALERSASNAQGFLELVLCPSKCGAHLVLHRNERNSDLGELVYKVKICISSHDDLAYFSLHEVDVSKGTHLFHSKCDLAVVGTLSKSLTIMAATYGHFSILQKWNLSAMKLEMKARTGLQHTRRVKNRATPSESTDLTVYMRRTCKIIRGLEQWDCALAFSDPEFRMELNSDRSILADSVMSTTNIYHRNVLVCTTHKQRFINAKRAIYDRPFLGLQIRAALREDAVPGKASIDGHRNLLPLLIGVAWGEESVLHPQDGRAAYMVKMRDRDFRGRVTSAEGCEALLDSSSLKHCIENLRCFGSASSI